MIASFVITDGIIHGFTNFERIGDTIIIKTHDDLKLTLCAHILVTDLVVDLIFSAYLTKISVRNKDLRIFLEKCVIYVELTLNLKRKNSTQVSKLKIVTIDGLESKTKGLMFPLNKSFDSVIRKVLHNLTANPHEYTEQLKLVINQYCDQYFDGVFKYTNFSDIFDRLIL